VAAIRGPGENEKRHMADVVQSDRQWQVVRGQERVVATLAAPKNEAPLPASPHTARSDDVAFLLPPPPRTPSTHPAPRGDPCRRGRRRVGGGVGCAGGKGIIDTGTRARRLRGCLYPRERGYTRARSPHSTPTEVGGANDVRGWNFHLC
jgi:hypothetical protein